MIKKQFYADYLNLMNEKILTVDHVNLFKVAKLIKSKRKSSKVIIIGNGGSAAIASHVSVDLTKVGKVRSINFNESDLLTCYANDYGFENMYVECLKSHADNSDLLIAISSSGMSKNIIKAAKYARNKGLKVITFTGFDKKNSLNRIGHYNFWVNSKAYNIVEMTHHIWLLSIVDSIIGKTEYPSN